MTTPQNAGETATAAPRREITMTLKDKGLWAR